MNVGFGKHADVDVRRLVLKNPDYVEWVLGEPSPSGKLATLAARLQSHIRTFDKAPFVTPCNGRGKSREGKCTRPTTRGTAYRSHSGLSVALYFWCDKCDPRQSGAAAMLIDVRTYREALDVVATLSPRPKKSEYAMIVGYLADAKGLPPRLTAKVLDEFFGP